MPPSAPDIKALQQALDRGVELHNAGHLGEAADIYRKVLQADPDHAVALNLLGVIATQSGKFETAVQLLSRSVDLAPGYGAALCNLGNAYQGQGDHETAATCYRKALAFEPDYPTAHFNLGVTCQQLADAAQAEYHLREAARLNPGYDKAHKALGDLLAEAGRPQEAITAYRRALDVNPEQVPVLINLGVSLSQMGQNDEARTCYEKALLRDPGVAEAHNNLGKLQRDAGHLDAALASHRKALEIAPDYYSALNNLAIVLRDLGQADEALQAARKTVERHPAQAGGHVTLGNILLDQLCLDEALACFERALELDPADDLAWSGRGVACKDQGRIEGAINSFNRALEIAPDNVVVKHNLALALLMNGDYRQGWQLYEHRWRRDPVRQGWRNYPYPQWDGSDPAGKTILVWAEQGMGDEIVYASLYNTLMERGASCYFACNPRLVPLFRRSFPAATVLAQPELPGALPDAPDIDYQCPAASLMKGLLTSLEGGRAREGYLLPDGARVVDLKKRYGGDGGEKLVGLGWCTQHAGMNRRYDVPFELFDNLLKTPGVRFVNLQYGDTRDALAASRRRSGVGIIDDPEIDPLVDMDAFAAQVAAMDLVISIVNSTAVMASALDVPVWGLVPRVSEWRWGNDGETCRWYPSMALYRQARHGDWASALDRLVPAFRAWAAAQ